jgi:peroxiredoxin
MGTLPVPGELAPDFELPDSTGAQRRLHDLVEDGPLVLIFYRGHW